ncbi:MAG TPA: VanZ family protein [Nitrospiraceae bacterium]|nr:VanZ family protein [Nitrospiraceae bacterium]
MSLSFATLIAYVGILGILAVASPGHGLLGAMLLVLPTLVLDWLHAPAYGLLAWLGITRFQRRGWPQPLAVAAGASFALIFGIWTETLQFSVPGRGLEIQDVLTDVVGIAMASLMVFWQSVAIRTAPAADPVNSHSITTLEGPA